MKTFLMYLAAVVLITAVISAIALGSRYLSNAVTPITVHEVAEGVTCATMVTGDGVAMDCWKH